MDGNRGAKGSIKDRIISMLYRMRYNKKKLKEEDYTLKNKNKQKEYLYKLDDFGKSEDIDTLEKKDKRIIESINVRSVIKTKKYKIQKNKSSINNSGNKIKESYVNTTIKKPRGINVSPVNVNPMYRETKVDIKKEIKKTNQEIIILSEVNIFINKSKECLDTINKQVEELKSETKNKNQDMSKIEEKYIKLRQQIDKLKTQYDSIRDKYDLSEFKIFESIKYMKSVENYKTLASLNEIELMVKICKKEINSIKSIEVVTIKNKTVGGKINSVKKEQSDVKIKFIKSDERIRELDSMESKISKELDNQKKIVDEMYDKVSYIDEKVVKTTEYVGERKLLSSLFKIAAGMLTLSLSKKKIFGFVLGATLINKGLKQLNKGYETREKIKIDIKYEDLTHELNSVSDKLSYTNKMLINSIDEVSKIKYNFFNKYREYSNVLPNYDTALNQIEDLEFSLKSNYKKLQGINDKVEYEKEENQKKLDKVLKIRQKNNGINV